MAAFKYFERIEAYLEKTMPVEELMQFEADLGTDPVLRTEFEAYRATQKVVDVLAFEQLGAQLKSLSRENNNADTGLLLTTPGKRRMLPPKLLSLAASLVFVLFAGSFWWSNTHYSNEELIRQHFLPPNLSTIRGTAVNDVLTKAAADYNEGNYASAIRLLEDVKPSHSAYIDAQWLLGFAYLKKEQAEAAIQSFHIVLSGNKEQLKASANWHLILAYLAAGQHDTAQSKLDKLLEDPAGAYYRKAGELNTRLQSTWRKLLLW